MTLDEQLRATLQGRAATLAPPSDPFPGVERRARGLRRRRVAASVAGTALAVLAVAGAVPLLAPDRSALPGPSDVATAPPSVAPSPAASGPAPSSTATAPASAYALDPAAPWRYRGQTDLGGVATTQRREVAAYARAWTERHPGTQVTPVFGQVWEPSGQAEVVVVSTGGDGARWGVLAGGESGAEVVWDVPLEPDTTVLVAVLAGDTERRVLAVAAPEVARLQLVRLPGDRETREPLSMLAGGVGTGALGAGAADAEVRGLVRDRIVAAEVLPHAPSAPTAAPANVLDWPTRGTVDPLLLLAVRRAYADVHHADVGAVEEKVLYAGAGEGGPGYLIGQFWLGGATEADTFGGVGSDEDLRVETRPPTAADTKALALFLDASDGPGSALVVVPQPGTAQVAYSPGPTADFLPVNSKDPAASGVVVLPRTDAAERGGRERLRLRDRDGTTTATLEVVDLLCGETSCG